MKNEIIEVWKVTLDNWYPSFKIRENSQFAPSPNQILGVKVVFRAMPDLDEMARRGGFYIGGWKVSVWGDDDTGLEKEFTLPDDRQEAFDLFQTIIAMKEVSYQEMLDMGLVPG